MNKKVSVNIRPETSVHLRYRREVGKLRRMEEDPGTSVRKSIAVESTGDPLARRILHEKLFSPYHIQRVQALTPDYRARVVFCEWILAKCVVNT
jgi:hypothetical protein